MSRTKTKETLPLNKSMVSSLPTLDIAKMKMLRWEIGLRERRFEGKYYWKN